MFVAVLGDNFFMVRKSSLASENCHFTSDKPTVDKSCGLALLFHYSICGSTLQDKHLEKAYEINLMEELTLKGITQVRSVMRT